MCKRCCKTGIPLSEWCQVRRKSSSLSAVRTTCHSFQTLDSPVSSVQMTCSFRPDPTLYREASVPACIRPDVSAARPDAYQFSNGSLILSKFQEKEDQSTVRTSDSCGPDAGASYMVTANSNSTIRTSAPHGPDACASDMEIACWSLVIRTLLPHGPDALSMLWKLLAVDVRPSGRPSHPV
jgi:hypothetical protein